MKVALLGGGNVYALNLARHLNSLGIDHFGIGRSKRADEPFWVEHHYRYWALHLVDHLKAVLAVLDTEKPDVIVNFAAQGEGAASFGKDAHYFYRTNTVGLVALSDALLGRSYVRRFIQIGSSEVYGSVKEASQEMDCLRPSSPYAVSKAAFDQHLEIMYRIHGFPANVIRPSNAYCPGQQLHRIIPKAILCALGGKKLQLQGGGKAEKSYLHATDLSKGIMTVLEKGEIGRIYNCGPHDPLSIKAVVMGVAAACRVPYESFVEEAPDRVGQDSCYWLNSTRLRGLGWTDEIGLMTGIEGMVEWVKKYPQLLKADTTFRIRP